MQRFKTGNNNDMRKIQNLRGKLLNRSTKGPFILVPGAIHNEAKN